MPREQVVHPAVRVFDADGELVDEGRLTYTVEPPTGGREVITNGVFVSWSPDQYAQIATSVSVESLRGLLREIDAGHINPEFGMVSFYTDIRRAEMNGLIKATRRARNSVYGVDE